MNQGFRDEQGFIPNGDEVGKQRMTWKPQPEASPQGPGEDVNGTADSVEFSFGCYIDWYLRQIL